MSEVYRIERAVLEDSAGAAVLRREGGDWLRDDFPVIKSDDDLEGLFEAAKQISDNSGMFFRPSPGRIVT